MSIVRRAPSRGVTSWAAAGLACCLTAAGATDDPPVANPIGGGQSVTLEPAPPPAAPRRHRAVFVCHEKGVPVFADRPCGSATATRSLVVATPPSGGAAASTAPPSPAASTRPRPAVRKPSAIVPPAPESACARLERQLDELNDRMRAGYSAREAARLWQRWRDTKDRLRTGRC